MQEEFFYFDRNTSIKKIDKNSYVQFINKPFYFPPESEKGNIEYKLKISNPSEKRFDRLLTQMNYRINESKGQAIYRLGVADNGLVVGLNKHHADLSLKTIELMAKRLNATVSILNEIKIKENKNIRTAYELLIKVNNNIETLPELRIAVLGNTNCGKSSLISVLTQSELDDGNGKARLRLGCRHRHELISGHTSSILREIFGLTKSGHVINYNSEINFEKSESFEINSKDNEIQMYTDRDILNNSKVLISLIDLGGKKKYLKTSIYGVISANFAFFVIDVTTDLDSEHLDILLTFNLPFLIILNKIDLVDESRCMFVIQNLSNYLINKNLELIYDKNDIDHYFNNYEFSNTIDILSNIPIIKSSSVSGQSIPLIYYFVSKLNDIPNLFNLNPFNLLGAQATYTTQTSDELEFLIEDVFYQNDNTCVVGGFLLSGKIDKDDQILTGPTATKKFVISRVLSIQRYKVTLNRLNEFESGSLELELDFNKNIESDEKKNFNEDCSIDENLIKLSENNSNKYNNSKSLKVNKFKIRKGMIIVSKNKNLSTIKIGQHFKVKLNVVWLKNFVKKGFECRIYVNNIKQGVRIEKIEGIKNEIQQEGEYSVILKFIKHNEVIRTGSNFFLYESTFRATGLIIDCCQLNEF